MLNPDGYRANVSAWRGALTSLASQGLFSRHMPGSSVLVLDLDDEQLLRSLESRQFGQPLALGTAVREAISNRHLLPLDSFLRSSQSTSERGWLQLPHNFLGWTLQQLGIADPARGEDKLPKGQYVIMANVEAAGTELARIMADRSSRFDRVFSKVQFKNEFAMGLIGNSTCRLSATDFDVLLTYLSRDKHMVSYDGHTVRLRGPDREPAAISDEDAAMASIKEFTASLKHQADLLNRRIDELGQTAKNAVARNNRVTALATLKSKKVVESTLSQRYATLHQLEELTAKIQQTSDQVQLVKIMESSAGVLKSLNAQIGGVGEADAVMDRLREQMDVTDEVAAILADSTAAMVDESEIDQELEVLEKEVRDKQDAGQQRESESALSPEDTVAQKQLESLPPIPNSEPVLARRKSLTSTFEIGITALSLQEHASEKAAESAL